MALVFFSKMLADLALYFTIGAYLISLLPSSLIGLTATFQLSSQLWPILLMLASALGCFLLSSKQGTALPLAFDKLRQLPLLLLPLCLFFAHSLGALLLLALPCAYIFWVVSRHLDSPAYESQRDLFVQSLKRLPLLLLPSILTFDISGLEQILLPYLILYLGSGVLLLRLLRHDASVLRQRGFRLLNLFSLLLCFLLSYEFSNGHALKVLSHLFNLFQHYILSPLLLLLGYGFSFVPWLFTGLIAFLADGTAGQHPTDATVGQAPLPSLEFITPHKIGMPHWLSLLLIGLLCSLVAWSAFLLGRRLLQGSHQGKAAWDLQENRSDFYSPRRPPRPTRDLLPPGEPAQLIRYYYRKFLYLCLSRRLPLSPNLTTAQISETAAGIFDPEQLNQLRQLYIQARYSNLPPSAEAAEQAKKLYHHLKKTVDKK